MTQNEPNDLLRLEDIRHDYPRFYPISQIHLNPTDNQSQIDLRNILVLIFSLYGVKFNRFFQIQYEVQLSYLPYFRIFGKM